MSLDPDSVQPLDLTGRDRQVRSAMGIMSHIAANFSRAARRTLPFLVKQKGRLVPGAVAFTSPSDDEPADGPRFVVSLEADEGNGWADLTLDAAAISVMLDGALGAAGGTESAVLTQELTLAQRALITRVARSLAGDFAQACREESGVPVKVVSARAVAPGENGNKPSTQGMYVRCDFDGMPVKASITLGVSSTGLEEAAREVAEGQTGHFEGDPRVADAIRDVSLTLIAELGNVKLNLREVLRLQAGDVLRLNTAIDDPITIRVGQLVKLRGSPVISRGQLAIEIRGRHGL
ncbi:MAG: FliM/FliN family flagellar motor switch protein [Polyangiaceae bacterium]|nr:FliM/FliN family flagellar motor switch protein [Polyangiaceae bacterium]